MPHTIIGKILEPLGLYQVNDAYMQVLTESLDDLDDDLSIVENNFESAHQIIHALKEGDNRQALKEVADYLNIEENMDVVAQAKLQILNGATLDEVLAKVDVPVLMLQIMRGVKRQLTYSYGNIMALMADSLSLQERISERSMQLPVIAEYWGWPERLGTQEALDESAEKVQQVRERAEHAQERVDCLRDTLERLIH